MIGTEVLVDALPDDPPYVWKLAPYLAASLVYNALDADFEKSGLHDGIIDSAEIEGRFTCPLLQ